MLKAVPCKSTIHSILVDTADARVVDDIMAKLGFATCEYNLSFHPEEDKRHISSLQDVFKAQEKLNARVDRDVRDLKDVVEDNSFDLQVAGEWVSGYIAAIHNELEELRNCMFWKHWCKEALEDDRLYEIHDLQNARVELIDIVFFVVSIALCLDMDADTLLRLYEKKLEVNNKRQDDGYSVADKTEDDNKAVV